MPITLNGTTGVVYPAGGTANTAGAGVGTSDTQTLTNKTLTTPTVATIKSAATSTPTVFQDSAGTEVGTLCRAWVNFNGTTSPGTIRASFNVSSVTKNGTGQWTVNFTNAFADTNYAPMLTTGGGGNTTDVARNFVVAGPTDSGSPTTKTTTALYVARGYPVNNTSVDGTELYVAIFR